MEHERTPPSDHAAELSVIGCVLAFAEQALPLVADLQSGDFHVPAHGDAWEAITTVADRGAPVDVLSVGEEIKSRGLWARFNEGWQTWALAAANQVPTWHNVGHYAGIVKQKAVLRKLINLCTEVICRAYANEPVDEVMSAARDGVADLEVDATSAGPVKAGDALASAVRVIDERARAEKPASVNLGIESVDRVLGGAMPGNLIVIAARPGKGKTALADTIAVNNAVADVPGLFFSLEMNTQELSERILSIRTKIPATLLRRGKELNYEHHKALSAAVGRFESAPLWIDDRPLRLGQIVGEARRWHAKEVRGKGRKIGYVVLDYVQLVDVEDERARDPREQQVSRISRTLKRMSKSIGCPVFVLAQLNRKSEEQGRKPIPSDLRESGSLEQDAHAILFPEREVSDDRSDANDDGPAEIIVAKNRSGKTGIAEAWWKAESMEFVSVETRREEPQRSWHSPDGE